MSLNTGMKMIKTETVTVENAAKTLGSGSLLVYGTPAMLLLVEKTAVALLDGHLDEGMTTVGTNLNVDHVSASPIGCEVSCEVTLTEIDRKNFRKFRKADKEEAMKNPLIRVMKNEK